MIFFEERNDLGKNSNPKSTMLDLLLARLNCSDGNFLDNVINVYYRVQEFFNAILIKFYYF